MRTTSTLFLLALTIPTLVSADLLRGVSEERQLESVEEAKLEKEFEGVEVVSIQRSSTNDEDANPNGGYEAAVKQAEKAIKKGKPTTTKPVSPFTDKEKLEMFKFKTGGKKYLRPLVQPNSCCCACSLPCECACDSAFDTREGSLKLGIIPGEDNEGDTKAEEKETAEERRKREKAERKAKRKAERRRERKRKEEARRQKNEAKGKNDATRQLGKVGQHYKERSVLMSCCQCESFPCDCKATVLVFRYDDV